MRELVRKHPWFFFGATLAGVALRLFFIIRFPAIVDDSKLYADIAKNWLQHGVYGLTDDHTIVPTYIRLPGYPAFLALIFALFGPDHYRPVLLVQMAADIGTCLLIADMARRMISARAAKAAFLLAAFCPFLANYTAAALTETLEVFFTALGLDLALVGVQGLGPGRMLPWVGCGVAVGAGILLRPDGGGGQAVIREVCWKEYREQRWLWLVMAGAALLLATGLAAALAPGGLGADRPQGQLRDYEARLGQPFAHDAYLAELTSLRDQLKLSLSVTAPEPGAAPLQPGRDRADVG